MVDENMYPTSELYVGYYSDSEIINICAHQPEHGEQHDFGLSISEWNVIKNKIKEAENDTKI